METDYRIVTIPIDPRPVLSSKPKKLKKDDFKITPNFIPTGWRVLRPREEVEEGDYRWKKMGIIRGYYIPATKIGEMVGQPITYIRRS